MYKPDPSQALEILRQAMEPLRRKEYVAPEAAMGRVLAEPVTLPVWPAHAVAWKDGVAVGGEAGQAKTQAVLTGQAVPQWAKRVVPQERLSERTLDQHLADAASERPEIMEVGREFAANAPPVAAGGLIGLADACHWAFLGIEKVGVWASPRVEIVVCGEQAEGGRVAALWLTRYLAEWGGTRQAVVVAPDGRGWEAATEEADLVILVSDGAPGRYASLSALWKGGIPDTEVLFWKWSLLPCKHTGLLRHRGRPVVLLPDLASKSMLAGLVLVPAIAEAGWCMPEPRRTWVAAEEELLVEPGAVRMVPVEIEGGVNQQRIRPIPVDRVFSGRDIAGANGWYASSRTISKGEPVEVVECRWGRSLPV